MYAGREAEVGPTSELFDHPRHRYTEALLGSVIRMESPWRTGLNSIPGRPPDLTAPLDGLPFRPSLCGRRRALSHVSPGGVRLRRAPLLLPPPREISTALPVEPGPDLSGKRAASSTWRAQRR